MKKLLFTQRRLVHHRRMAKVVGLVVLCLLIFNSFFSEAQNPLVKMWDYRFGGDSMESFTCFIQTSDGGFILGGTTDSPISGDKTDSLRGSPGDDDYWIVKTDSLGNKQWDKDFGGTSEDNLISILQTTDGGYILAGSSSSGIGGDKTQSNWGNNDYWI
ncbi:MAG: hypothetical protein NTV09_03825, partial [Bacteroidetes bacterium]|nr:hypothetical protein [Bacteroidota bacterium]